jgi:hypothetical protein
MLCFLGGFSVSLSIGRPGRRFCFDETNRGPHIVESDDSVGRRVHLTTDMVGNQGNVPVQSDTF